MFRKAIWACRERAKEGNETGLCDDHYEEEFYIQESSRLLGKEQVLNSQQAVRIVEGMSIDPKFQGIESRCGLPLTSFEIMMNHMDDKFLPKKK